jgi:hypothetical protein
MEHPWHDEDYRGTIYRLTFDTGEQRLVSPQQLQAFDPHMIVNQERFEHAHWVVSINDVNSLRGLAEDGRWVYLDAWADDSWEDAARHPLAYSGQGRDDPRDIVTLYRVTLHTGEQHLVSPQEIQEAFEPSTIAHQERFEQACWVYDERDGAEHLRAVGEYGVWNNLESHDVLTDGDVQEPLTLSGEERQETREQTETVGRTFLDRARDVAERMTEWVRRLGQDRSQGMG